MNEYANVTVATLAFPADGKGAVSAIRGSASVGATTTYTANTATDTAAGWTLGGVALGDYAFTADGLWGIVQSYAPAANNNVLTVDRWRAAGRPGSGGVVVPAALGVCTVHSTSHIAGSPGVVLKQLILTKALAADTVAVTDQRGVNLTNFVFTLPTGVQVGLLADFGDGIYFPHPIGFKLSAATSSILAVYDSSGYGPM